MQLENLQGGEQVYQQRVLQHLVPCVGQFAVALADDTQWKTLNYQILLKTRHTDSKVRTHTHTHAHAYPVLSVSTVPWVSPLRLHKCYLVSETVNRKQDLLLTVHFLYQCHMVFRHGPIHSYERDHRL